MPQIILMQRLIKNFSIENTKSAYLALSPIEKWQYVHGINLTLLRNFGVEYTNANYKPNTTTMLPIAIQFDYWILLCYTLFYYRSEPLRALVSTPSIGIYVPVKY